MSFYKIPSGSTGGGTASPPRETTTTGYGGSPQPAGDVTRWSNSPTVLFERWYVGPLRALLDLDRGDGGIVALGFACALYERSVRARINRKFDEAKADREAYAVFAADFGTDDATAEKFWGLIRNGLLHSAMPNSDPTIGWRLSARFPGCVAFDHQANEIQINVRLLCEKVVAIWRDNLHLLDQAWAPFGIIIESD